MFLKWNKDEVGSLNLIFIRILKFFLSRVYFIDTYLNYYSSNIFISYKHRLKNYLKTHFYTHEYMNKKICKS